MVFLVSDSLINDALESLSIIESDTSVPKNVRQKIKTTISILSANDGNNLSLNISKSIQELSDVAEDPDIEQHIKMQVWTVVSLLESK